MKKLPVVLFFVAAFNTAAISGNKILGEVCDTYDDISGQMSSECIPGLICGHGTGSGICYFDCAYQMTEGTMIPFAGFQWEQGANNTVSLQCVQKTDVESHPTLKRCAVGYYGPVVTSGTPQCTPCPGNGTTRGNAVVGGFSVTSCVIKSGATGADTTGTFTVSADCPWVE